MLGEAIGFSCIFIDQCWFMGLRDFLFQTHLDETIYMKKYKPRTVTFIKVVPLKNGNFVMESAQDIRRQNDLNLFNLQNNRATQLCN